MSEINDYPRGLPNSIFILGVVVIAIIVQLFMIDMGESFARQTIQRTCTELGMFKIGNDIYDCRKR